MLAKLFWLVVVLVVLGVLIALNVSRWRGKPEGKVEGVPSPVVQQPVEERAKNDYAGLAQLVLSLAACAVVIGGLYFLPQMLSVATKAIYPGPKIVNVYPNPAPIEAPTPVVETPLSTPAVAHVRCSSEAPANVATETAFMNWGDTHLSPGGKTPCSDQNVPNYRVQFECLAVAGAEWGPCDENSYAWRAESVTGNDEVYHFWPAS